MITNYLAWHQRHRPRDTQDRPVWPRVGIVEGYADASFMLQAHYMMRMGDEALKPRPRQISLF